MRRLLWIFLLPVSVWFASCNATKHVPTGEYLLVKNNVRVAREPRETGLSRKEVIRPGELEPFIRQRRNKRFLGTNFYIWVHNQVNPDRKNTWWNRQKARIGESPVILDTTLAQRTTREMNIFLREKGFLNAETSYAIDSARKKARVTYHAIQNRPYRIRNITYDFRDQLIHSVFLSDSAATLIRSGNLLDIGVLDDERARITEYLKNRGYFNFSINNITYSIDSTVGNYMADLTMVVRQFFVGFDENGNPIMDNSRIYRIRDINVFPNFDPIATTEPDYEKRLDTIVYRGMNIIYDTRLNVRSEILRRTINLYPNYIYDADQVRRTYDNIMRLGYFRSASILFVEHAQDSISDQNFITFIGGDLQDSLAYTREIYLTCNIRCIPAKRHSYTIELEGTTTSAYFGILTRVGYQNRNLFRGVELFEASLLLGYEFMRVKGRNHSFEIGGSVALTFPRWITPFRIDRFGKNTNPRTRVEFSLNHQRRPVFDRVVSAANFGYSWGNARVHNFIFRPIDISVIKINSVDSTFLKSLNNIYLEKSFESQIIAGLSGSYIYNNQLREVRRNSFSSRINLELNGNLLNGLNTLFGRRREGDDFFRLFNVRYAQYFRIDANVVRRFVLGEKTSLVWRFFGGWGYAYGNSFTIPFERFFFCGGNNSMRGWIIRTLGPGEEPAPPLNNTIFPAQVGSLRLETNLEARFPVWGFLHGAIFFDVGNVWFTSQSDANSSEGVFRFNTFSRQLGFNTGIGARFDFNFVILRIDVGFKLHNPNAPAGHRWVNTPRFGNTALNFGVGYPF